MEPQELGCSFQPFPEKKRLGYKHLEVCLRPEPSGRHFDPEGARFLVVSPVSQSIEGLTVTHPWPRSETYQVLVGRIILHNKAGKVFEAFSFGGKLEIQAGEALTFCRLTSSAPILNLISEEDLDGMLAQEVEVLLAERRAHWAQSPDELDRRLLGIDPGALYGAFLASMRQRLGRTAGLLDETYQPLLHVLRTESERYPAVLGSVEKAL